jgi:YjbE family integral membrane protein
MDFSVLSTSQFWLALLAIIWIDIILSGDNAVLIALAARNLPPQQQKKAVMIGAGAAIALRVVLTLVAFKLLTIPYLKMVGGGLLLWIGVKLLTQDDDHEEGAGAGAMSLAAAVRTILIADFVMSLDNVIAVAAASKGSELLLILGLLISIPLVVYGSQFMIKLMDKYPFIITAGAALIGWIGGETMATDYLFKDFIAANPAIKYVAAALGAAFVIGVGRWLQRLHKAKKSEGIA